jgi:hypothetical protein
LALVEDPVGIIRLGQNAPVQIALSFKALSLAWLSRLTVMCHLQEADFNLGRAYHQLGLVHLAVPYYEKALSAGFRESSRTKDGMEVTEEGLRRRDTGKEAEGDVQEGVCTRMSAILL